MSPRYELMWRELLLALALAACNAPGAPATPAPLDWRARTAAYLDARATDWVEHTPQVGENFACAMSCHTTHTYLIARPLLRAPDPNHTFAKIRARIEERVGATTPYYGAPGSVKERESRGSEAVLEAATLVLADRAMGGEPRPIARTAFARMWRQQRADGGFDWLDFGLDPWEAGGDWGAMLAALTAGAMPADARDATRPQLDRLVAYLRARLHDTDHPPPLHDQMMLLRAAGAIRELLTDAERAAIVDAIVAQRRSDGGWSLPTWGRGVRTDEDAPSDGYATAYATLALCEARVASDATRAGVQWLEAHRRADGSWSGRSVNSDAERNQQYMSDAATAYAVLALAACR